MGVSFVAAVIWRRANRWGAWASLLTALAVYYGGTYLRATAGSDGFQFRIFVKWYADLSLYALSGGALTMVLFSLLTPPEEEKQLDDFYTRLHTPAVDGSAEPTAESGERTDARLATEQ
jgi:Na+(H+)/acetate symporter ActP